LRRQLPDRRVVGRGRGAFLLAKLFFQIFLIFGFLFIPQIFGQLEDKVGFQNQPRQLSSVRARRSGRRFQRFEQELLDRNAAVPPSERFRRLGRDMFAPSEQLIPKTERFRFLGGARFGRSFVSTFKHFVHRSFYVPKIRESGNGRRRFFRRVGRLDQVKRKDGRANAPPVATASPYRP